MIRRSFQFSVPLRGLALFAAASGLTGCGGGTDTDNVGANNVAQAAERACTPPRTHWLQPTPLDAGLSPPINRLAVDRNGVIYWNGRPTSRQVLFRYLDVVATMNPRPAVFLETEMGTPCALVETLRGEMDRRLQCRDGGMCAEGIWRVWQDVPIPPGTPPS